jgi:transposase
VEGNAVVILRAIQAEGYAGGISTLKDYIRPKRVLCPSCATVRFETAPGVQLQHDWGRVETGLAGQRCRMHFAVNMGFSCRFHFHSGAWFKDNEVKVK